MLIDRVGRGSFGEVYRAYDPQLERFVAIKLVAVAQDSGDADSVRSRALREARALARVEHPRVVPIYDAGVFDGQVYLAMGLVDGAPLSAWLRDAPRSPREVLEAFIAAGEGLAAVHGAGLVHRDFKPDNVVVGKDGVVRLLDFGLARAVRDAGDGGAASPPGEGVLTGWAGTPAYMAPEQYLDQPCDARTDQFSFCVALFEALEGVHPFPQGSPAELALAVTQGRVRPFSANGRTPAKVQRALQRGLSMAPERRHPDMGALLRELQRAARPRRLGLIVATGGALALLAGALVVARREGPPSCEAEGAAALESAWNRATGDHLEAAFARSKRTYGAETGRKVRAALDAYTTAWSAERRSMCKVPAEDPLRSARMQCSSEQLALVSSLTKALREPDEETVDRAVSAVSRLPAPQECQQPEDRILHVPLPAAPELREPVAGIVAELTESSTLQYLGKRAEVLRRVAALRERVAALDYPPLTARYSFAVYGAHMSAGQVAEATSALEITLRAAAQGRRQALWIGALSEYAYSLAAAGYTGKADAFIPVLEAASGWVAPGSESRQGLLRSTMSLHERGWRPAEVVKVHAQLERETSGQWDRSRPHLLRHEARVAVALRDLGRIAEATRLIERLIAEGEAALGADHPDVALTYLDASWIPPFVVRAAPSRFCVMWRRQART